MLLTPAPVACISSSFLFLSSIPLYGHTTFVYSLVDRHFGYLLFMAIMMKASINIGVRVFMWTYVFLFGRRLGIEIAGSYGKCMCSFIRNCQTVLKTVFLESRVLLE